MKNKKISAVAGHHSSPESCMDNKLVLLQKYT